MCEYNTQASMSVSVYLYLHIHIYAYVAYTSHNACACAQTHTHIHRVNTYHVQCFIFFKVVQYLLPYQHIDLLIELLNVSFGLVLVYMWK